MSFPSVQIDTLNQLAWARDIGQRVAKLRHVNNLTQADLANSSGKSLATISKLEQATSGFPALQTLVAVAEVLDISLDFLVLGAEPEAPTCMDIEVELPVNGVE